MNIIYKSFSLCTLVIFFFLNTNAQCSYLLPADVHVISVDSSINNSFLPSQQFLICPGKTLTVYGNSTGFNKFYLESGSTVLFSDSVGATPYGMYSFYLKSGATLHYNASSPVAFPFIDTLVWENGAMMIDTGSLFHLDSLCSTVVFDYSVMTSLACASTMSISVVVKENNSASPNPFTDELNIHFNNSTSENEMLIYDLLGKELEHFYSVSSFSKMKMKSDWSGVAILEIRNRKGESHFQKIIRE